MQGAGPVVEQAGSMRRVYPRRTLTCFAIEKEDEWPQQPAYRPPAPARGSP